MNTVVLLGRLVREPDVRYTKSGKCVTSFTLAVNRSFKNADGKYDADFISCIAWGTTGEVVGNYVSKGQRLLVNGELRVRNYEDKSGNRRYVTEVNVHIVDFIEQAKNGKPASTAPAANSSAEDTGGFDQFGQEASDEEIPF